MARGQASSIRILVRRPLPESKGEATADQPRAVRAAAVQAGEGEEGAVRENAKVLAQGTKEQSCHLLSSVSRTQAPCLQAPQNRRNAGPPPVQSERQVGCLCFKAGLQSLGGRPIKTRPSEMQQVTMGSWQAAAAKGPVIRAEAQGQW